MSNMTFWKSHIMMCILHIIGSKFRFGSDLGRKPISPYSWDTLNQFLQYAWVSAYSARLFRNSVLCSQTHGMLQG